MKRIFQYAAAVNGNRLGLPDFIITAESLKDLADVFARVTGGEFLDVTQCRRVMIEGSDRGPITNDQAA